MKLIEQIKKAAEEGKLIITDTFVPEEEPENLEQALAWATIKDYRR